LVEPHASGRRLPSFRAHREILMNNIQDIAPAPEWCLPSVDMTRGRRVTEGCAIAGRMSGCPMRAGLTEAWPDNAMA
jgi:hypothetical protein